MTLSIGRRSANYSSAGSMLTVSQISGNAKHLHTLLHQAQAHPSIGAAGGFSQKGIEALFGTNDPLFFNRRVQMVILAAYHRLPAIYALREFAEIGGLASYGTDFSDQLRLAACRTWRIM
jgi:putative ABC transport system substrate-binding protein